MPSEEFLTAWLMLRMCARKVSDNPRPAASSAARVMRRPDDRRSTERLKLSELTLRLRWAEMDAGLLLTIIDIAPSSLGQKLDHPLRLRHPCRSACPSHVDERVWYLIGCIKRDLSASSIEPEEVEPVITDTNRLSLPDIQPGQNFILQEIRQTNRISSRPRLQKLLNPRCQNGRPSPSLHSSRSPFYELEIVCQPPQPGVERGKRQRFESQRREQGYSVGMQSSCV